MCAVLWQHRENLDQWAVRNTCVFFFFSTFFLTAEASIRFSDRVAMPKLHNPRTNTAPLKETGLHNISLWDTFFTFFIKVMNTLLLHIMAFKLSALQNFAQAWRKSCFLYRHKARLCAQ